MPTFQSANAAAGNCGGSNVPAGMTITATGTWTVPAGTVATDVVEMVAVPKGAVITGITLQASGGTASLSLDIGDADTPDRLIDGFTNTAAAVATTADIAAGALGYAYTADDTVDMTLVGAGATETHVYTMVVTYVVS